MKLLYWSLAMAVPIAGILIGVQAHGGAEGVARLTAPFTCDGTVTTGSSVYSEPGETTTSLIVSCERADGTREQITGRVVAVEFVYVWLVSALLLAGMVRMRKGPGGQAE